jgi:hypothetical protein
MSFPYLRKWLFIGSRDIGGWPTHKAETIHDGRAPFIRTANEWAKLTS